MGLDNFWVGDDSKHASVEGDFKICGGICSGHGNSSFRGKVYNDIVEKTTGVSLYSDKIDNDKVVEMDDAIRQVSYDLASRVSNYPIQEEEWSDFQVMWHEHAKAGHHLVSWY